MPIEVHSISNGLGLHFIYSGELCHEESRQVNRILRDEPLFDRARFCLIDNLLVEKHHISTEEIHISAEFCRRRSETIPNFIVAVLAGSNLSYGLGRMWESLSNDTPWAIRVFRPHEDDIARDWVSEQYQDIFSEPLTHFECSEIVVPELKYVPGTVK
jgi:hypothetical protein